jgi:hypothetical protein
MKVKFSSIVSLLVAVSAPLAAQAQFPDVFGADPNYGAIQYVADQGIVQGYPSGNYGPDVVINRAEFVKIMAKTQFAENEIASCNTSYFSDVPKDSWFSQYVCISKERGVIDGYPDKTFKPDSSISFVEAAKILRNTLLGNDLIVPAKDYDDWYGIYVDALSQKNAIPFSINGFDHLLTRGEIAQMIYRLHQHIDTLPSLKIDEIEDRKLIESYYDNITSQKFDVAYAMKVSPEQSLENFKTLYKDFGYSRIFDFKKTDSHTYEFVVMTFPNVDFQADRSASERFEVSMKVVGDKLQTLSSRKLDYQLLEELSNGPALEWVDGAYRISVYHQGVMVPKVEVDTAESIAPILKNISASSDGKYFTYQTYEWEGSGVGLYDLENNKAADSLFNGIGVYGFTSDNKHFYFCSEAGMGSGALFVMDLPGFTRHVLGNTGDEAGKNMVASCGPFDSSTNTLHYELIENDTNKVLKGAYTIK